MTDIDEAMLIALVDGELDEVNRRRVERAVAADPALAERLARHRRLRDKLAGHYAPVAQEPVPERLRSLIGESAVVVPIRPPARRRWTGWAMGGAIAAALVMGLGVGRMTGGQAGPIGMDHGVMVAQGPLAAALETQLASTQGDAAIRIGMTFQRKGGGWCRSFDGMVAGVACREGSIWQVQQALPGAGQASDYRQASSADMRTMATVDALIAGSPVDAAGEKTAQAGGWR
ncbi:anti-sigma factor family protein [Sphingobium sp.]|uniref:anti-sigma factor family protein n=1 Tax=Sphingobium sp. TaxID=1912891 RepID=UPI003B3AB38D